MYRIFIDAIVEKCAINFAKEVLKAKPYKTELQYFKNNLTCSDKTFELAAKDYIQLLLNVYKKNNATTRKMSLSDSILSDTSSSFSSYISQFETIIPQKKLKTPIKYTNSKGKICDGDFWQVLVKVMDYGRFKSTYYQCIEDIGISTCVYCNMAPADKCDANFANYQMEHFYPKNKFPFLSTSFFNFFPSCGTCNQKKGKKFDKDGFDLYREKISDCPNPFKFTTQDAYCYYKKIGDDRKKFGKETNVLVFFSSPFKYAEKQIKKLQIEKRYNCRRVRKKIFDLLKNYEYNTHTRITVTQKTFPLIPLKPDQVYGVFGACSKEEDIHEEQLTKFSIDFGKESGMLL